MAGQFLQRCVGDLETLRVLLRRLRTGDAGALSELEHLAHQVCGTGALLGFESLSLQASAIERLAETHAPGAAADPIVTDRLLLNFALLENEIHTLIAARK